jgi:hypothetical protein
MVVPSNINNPSLVTPMKDKLILMTLTKNNADYEPLSTSRSIQSGRTTSAVLGKRPAARFTQADALAGISSE